jgi:hypothetical protein
MPKNLKLAQTFVRRGAAVASTLIVGTELIAEPYELTALSVGSAVLTVSVPAALGMLSIRMDLPAQFNVKERERLAQTSPQVSNVNVVMDKKKAPLHSSTTNILLEQDAMKPTYGSAEDRAYEAYVVGSFYNAYIHSKPTAASLEEKSSEELAKIRQDRSLDAVGVAAHTLFSAGKHFKYSLLNPELNKYKQSARSKREQDTMEAHMEEMQTRFVHTRPGPTVTTLLTRSVAEISGAEALGTVKAKFNQFKQSYLEQKTEGSAADLKAGTTNTPEPDTTPNKFRL